MTELQKVRAYTSLDRPYEAVRDALHRLLLAGPSTGPVRVQSLCHQEHIAGLPCLTRVTLDWNQGDPSTPLTLSSAELYAFEASSTETTLELEGHGTVPYAYADAGGAAGERLVLSRLEALLDGLVEQLRRDIDSHTSWRRRRRSGRQRTVQGS
jgi:hypothetical protein